MHRYPPIFCSILLMIAVVLLQSAQAVHANDLNAKTADQLLVEAKNSIDQGDYADALALLGRAYQKDKKNLQIQKLIGQIEAEHFTPARGLAFLTVVQNQQPNMPGVLMYLGKAYAQLNQNERAVKYYKKALAAHGDTPKLALWHGQALIELGRYAQAKQAFARVPASGTRQSARAQYELAILKLRDGDRKAARQHINAAADAEPDPIRRLTYLSRLQVAQDDSTGGKAYANSTLSTWRALSLEPTYTDSRIPFANDSETDWLTGSIYVGLEIDNNVSLVDDNLLPASVNDDDDESFVTSVYLQAELWEVDDWTFGLRTNLFNASHFAQEETDFAQIALSPYAKWSSGNFSVDTHMLLAHSWAGGSDYENNVGAGVTGEWRQTDWTASSLYYRYTNREVLPATVTTFTDRDGHIQTVGFSQSFLCPDLPLSLTVGFEHEWQDTEGSDYDYDAWLIYVGIRTQLPWDVTLDVTYSHREADYENPNSLNLFAFARDDERDAVSVRFTKPLADSLDLIFEYRYQDNGSNMNQFDYTQSVYALGLRYSF